MPALYSSRAAPWLLLAPALTIGMIFYVAPIVSSFYLSFTNWNALGPAQWQGLGNYRVLLTTDPTFTKSLINTIALAVGSALIGIPVALVLALTITAGRYRAGWRAVFWLPAITNIVAVSYGWQMVLDPTYGVANQLLALIGIAGPDWLAQPVVALLSLAVVMAWMTLGQNILLFSTGLEAIDPTVIEAARIDGASSRQIVRYITLPLLKPTLLFVLVTTLIAGMGSFALIMVMTDGGPDDKTIVTALYMYRMAFESLRIGRACAVAIILMAVTLILAIIQLRLFGSATDASA